MIVIYKFQLDKLQSILQENDASKQYVIVGGRRKQQELTVTSLYPMAGQKAGSLKEVLRKRGENVCGVICLAGGYTGPGGLDFVINIDNTHNPDACGLEGTGEGFRKVVVKDIDYVSVRKSGMLLQVNEGYYAMRLKITAGNLTADKLEGISRLARQYGNGTVHITSRQGIEIPFVHFSDLTEFFADMTKLKLELGASGPRVRAVVACQGKQVCRNGLIDASELAERLSAKYWDLEMPHKFKIAVTGCPSNCLKVDDNDCGIKGVAKVIWESDRCVYCGICAQKCERGAITIQKNEHSILFDETKCIKCGKCQNYCPLACISTKKGFRLTFGGTFGKDLIIGRQVFSFVETEQKAEEIIQKALKFYKQYGRPKERLAKTIERIGWEIFTDSVKV